jgi:superfamily I DNA and RNA helicase
MIKDLSRDELDMMRKDRNDFRLNKHFNNQPVFLLAATQGGFPPFAKEGEIITFTGTTDWKTYNIINDMGQTVALPSLTFISAYPDPE